MIKLDSFVNIGPTTIAVTNTLSMPGGSVQIHRPFIPLGGGPAITPNVAVKDMALVIRLDEWHPMWLDDDGHVAVLPMSSGSQDVAASAARAFAADPAIAWNAPREVLLAWCQRYVADLQARQVVGQTTNR